MLGKSHDAFLLFICSVTHRSLTFNTQINFLVCVFSPTHPSPLWFYSLGLLGLHTDGWTQGRFSRHQATSSFSVSKTQCQPSLLGYFPQRLNCCCSPLHLKSREVGLQYLPLPTWWSIADLRSHSALWSKLKPSAWRITVPGMLGDSPLLLTLYMVISDLSNRAPGCLLWQFT